MQNETPPILWFEELRNTDISRVGGKNASLGEMVANLASHGIKVPRGFAIPAQAYRRFLDHNALGTAISSALGAFADGKRTLAESGAAIRQSILSGDWPTDTADAIRLAYADLCRDAGGTDIDVAVRSSATAEDLPDASFAGQQETYLNVRGTRALLDACRRCYASLFTDRAISYRQARGVDHLAVALSVGVQRMVRSDRAGAGVMFSIDTETGFDKVTVINAAWGLGENVVQGTVDPDEYEVFTPLLADPALVPIIGKRLGEKAKKLVYGSDSTRPTKNVPTSGAERAAFVLSDPEIITLSRWGGIIAGHYGRPMDIEWAKDGETGEIFIVQARPETVQSRREAGAIRTYRIRSAGRKLLSGTSIGEAVASGPVCIIRDRRDIARFVDGAILVTETTDPDWVPVMRRAAAIITDHGGRTSHAAIVSRELGLSAIVGAGIATHLLHDEQEVTVSCAEGREGFVYEGIADVEVEELDFSGIPATRTKVMLNLANPAAAFRWWRLSADGIGLARMEFVVSNHIRVHPMALVRYETLADTTAKRAIEAMTAAYPCKPEYFVDRLARGLGRIAAVQYPHPVIVRMSDFKSNEYANLIGGAEFEPHEDNPMIGLRGASRYYSPRYQDGFALECQAIARLRKEMGFTNVIVMIPFCRTVSEADRVLGIMAANGLERHKDDLKVYVMCEIPSNVILADAFAQRFDGFSIGSNDLTQLTLGIDRDSSELAGLFDEEDDAVKRLIQEVIRKAHQAGVHVGLCGQAPSDRPAFAGFLVECGIDSVSVSPDSFIRVKRNIAVVEASTARTAGATS